MEIFDGLTLDRWGTVSATFQYFHDVLQGPARRRLALWLLLATGCSRSALNTSGKDSSVDSSEATSSGGTSGQSGDGNVADAKHEGGTRGIPGNGGVAAFGGKPGSGGLIGSGGGTRTGGVAGTGGIVRTGGAVGRGGTPGTGGPGGTGGGMGGRGVLGLLCTTNQDCPSNSTCCDGSDPSCDGTRLPSGDSANPGEFVVSPDGLTVTDKITGLVWQRDGLGARAGCSGSGNLDCSWAEAEAYCTSLVLGELSGWRLPAWMELLTILDFTTDTFSATSDPTAFPDTSTSSYWTSSLYMGSSFEALYVSFADGTSEDCSGLHNFVRCVRGSRCYPTSRFVVLDGGLVRDTLTELVWQQQASATKMTWADAKSYCSSLVSGGSGFRLPTLKELDSLVDPTVTSGPTLDKTAFPNTGEGELWTSSPYTGVSAGSPGYARYGDFSSADPYLCDNSGQNWTAVGATLPVRCVR